MIWAVVRGSVLLGSSLCWAENALETVQVILSGIPVTQDSGDAAGAVLSAYWIRWVEACHVMT
jgi:hypothetical protein